MKSLIEVSTDPEITKRARRRAKREMVFGPEKGIVSSTDGIETLSCGHTFKVPETHVGYAKFRRCIQCKVST